MPAFRSSVRHWPRLFGRRAVLAFAAVAILGFGSGQEARAQQVAREGVPVIVANRTIIVLRGPIAGHTARERATSTMERIEQALAEEQIPAVSTTDTHGVQIMSPHYMTDPAAPQVVPKKDWYAAPARPPEGQKRES